MKRPSHLAGALRLFAEDTQAHDHQRFGLPLRSYPRFPGVPFNPFSAFTLGFDQKITEIPYFGDFRLLFSLFYAKLEKRRAVLVEITPRISVPEIQTAFPLYIGLGAGLGFYPHYIVRKIPSLSVSGQIFTGLRLLDLYHNLGFSGELNLRVHSPFNELKIYLEIFGQFGFVFSF